MEKNNLADYKNLFGLIGFPLSHSFSKKHFSNKFLKEGIENCFYDLFPLEKIDQFPTLIEAHRNLKGLNVTLPYKELVIPFLDDVDESAKGVGAVNTIKVNKGKLIGFNTDVFGFEKSLKQFLRQHIHSIQNALILGTGGAAKAVKFVLSKNEIPYSSVSRNAQKGDFTYNDLDEKLIKSHQLIINTTPLGMVPKSNTFPNLKYSFLDSNHFLFDLVYNPEKTVFLIKGLEQGCSVMNGLPMLYYQAEKAWEIWND